MMTYSKFGFDLNKLGYTPTRVTSFVGPWLVSFVIVLGELYTCVKNHRSLVTFWHTSHFWHISYFVIILFITLHEFRKYHLIFISFNHETF